MELFLRRKFGPNRQEKSVRSRKLHNEFSANCYEDDEIKVEGIGRELERMATMRNSVTAKPVGKTPLGRRRLK